MQLLNIEIGRECNIYQLGDIHWGTIFCHEKGFMRAIEDIGKDKLAKVVLVGDLIEAIAVDDPRYDSDTNKEPVPFIQAQEMVNILKPIKKKIVAILKGNHELRLVKYLNVSAYIAKELGVDYGTWTSKIQFMDKKGKHIFKGYFAHGDMKRSIMQSNSGDPIQRQANEKAMLKRLMFSKAGDCLYMGCGHYHKLITIPPSEELYLTDNGEEIHQSYRVYSGEHYIHPDLRFYGCSGAFYKQFMIGHDSYSEMHGYRPTELGYLVLRVSDRLQGVEKVYI
jgi:Calcineurin-like phosphoesterase